MGFGLLLATVPAWAAARTTSNGDIRAAIQGRDKPDAPGCSIAFYCDGKLQRTQSFRLNSNTGREFQIYVIRPAEPPPAGGYPTVYFLDADASLGMMVATARALEQAGRTDPVALVGIGVPRDGDLDAWYKRVGLDRSYDYTPPVAAEALGAMNPGGTAGGGAPQLLDLLERQLMPEVAARIPVDPRRRILTGHSYGGLFTLFALLERPGLFAGYMISSPSIWYGDGAVLASRAGFAERLRGITQLPRVMIVSGADEEPTTANAHVFRGQRSYRRLLAQRRMNGRIAQMQDWLMEQGLTVGRRIAPEADHVTAKIINLPFGLAYMLGRQRS